MPTSISDRNLLFGIVALQMDFINRDQLVTAMHDWVLMKSKPLGRLLVERESLTDDTCTLLESLVEKHLAHHNHDVTKSLAAVGSSSFRDDFIAFDDPDVQATLAHLPNSADDAEMHAAMTLVVGKDSSDGQRFRRLRPHAKGGLGEVWVAEDLELHREVALKEIQPRVADNADSRARFVMEAEITGGLEHPGIVPVYGLGKHADGRPYYAMRFIRGTDLKEEIERFHARDNAAEGKWRDLGERTLELRKLLDRFIDVCNAIEYAHSRGVIHRDIKPSNIMLGKYGETLVVDWGLAKPVGKLASHTDTDERAIEPMSGSGSSETQMGSAVGTPQFMAPEQAAGRVDKMGRASDVYSLGATLFDLLAGQPPFTEGNVPTILRNVQDGIFPRPRQVKSLVPRPLEAVCLKAMALRIEDRYDSARELADDVERYLADEPVSAYTEPLIARVYRWVRNHRVRVAISTGVLVAILASAIAAALVLRAQNETQEIAQRQQKDTKSAALADEETAANLTGQNDFGSAEQVLSKALARLGNDVSFHQLRKRLSEKLDRAQRLNQFSLLIENAWRFHFHEYDDDAIVACDKALRQLRVFDQERWWEHLPDDELTELQADQLREQAHAALLLYATEVAKYTLPEAGLLDFARSLFGQGNSDLYRISLHLCQLAQAFHPTQVGSLLDVYCRFGVGEISPAALPEELLELTINAPAPKCALDHHFLGGAHFLLAADPTSPLSGAIRFLNKRVNLGIDTENAKFTARRPQRDYRHVRIGRTLRWDSP
ncbi:MAG: serine/threonine protein kinase [Planctomycetes bacterium]|nr:serine/threonine protein kinase [Planctomycetota bacterium]